MKGVAAGAAVEVGVVQLLEVVVTVVVGIPTVVAVGTVTSVTADAGDPATVLGDALGSVVNVNVANRRRSVAGTATRKGIR